MSNDPKQYMKRCLDLASNGLGKVAPNPMVGCVLVRNGKVIGEGYHRAYGKPHAELIAIDSVQNKEGLKKATLYVNLEPCNHQGKTPACTDRILREKIPRVVIGNRDPNKEVTGKGIERLKQAGVEVDSGLLDSQCRKLNRRFFTFHRKKRPYIILKWAKTTDGFIAGREKWLSNQYSRLFVHKWRSEEQVIMAGTGTIKKDNPQLTTRLWAGSSPLRIVVDKNLELDDNYHVFDRQAQTWIVNEKQEKVDHHVKFVQLKFGDDLLEDLLTLLHNHYYSSMIVEGGQKLLNTFIREGLWDEARVFIAPKYFGKGLQAPRLPVGPSVENGVAGDRLLYFENPRNAGNF